MTTPDPTPDPMPWATLLLAMWPLWFALLVLLVLGLLGLLGEREHKPHCGQIMYGPDAQVMCSLVTGHHGTHLSSEDHMGMRWRW